MIIRVTWPSRIGEGEGVFVVRGERTLIVSPQLVSTIRSGSGEASLVGPCAMTGIAVPSRRGTTGATRARVSQQTSIDPDASLPAVTRGVRLRFRMSSRTAGGP